MAAITRKAAGLLAKVSRSLITGFNLKHMNQTHIRQVSQHFDLGTPTQAPTRVHGGLLHIMWRLDTDKGSYAIKQLSKDIDLKNAASNPPFIFHPGAAKYYKEKGLIK